MLNLYANITMRLLPLMLMLLISQYWGAFSLSLQPMDLGADHTDAWVHCRGLEYSILNADFGIQNDEFCIKDDGLWGRSLKARAVICPSVEMMVAAYL